MAQGHPTNIQWTQMKSKGKDAREPIVHSARLDVSNEATLRLTAALCQTQRVLLEHVVAVAGPDLTGTEALGSLLGIRFVQAAEGVLQLWSNRLRRERGVF
ncbi:hypothetical protein D4764_0188380 [Takifugu flavidus]|uniref:Uncharacterized protein n=1 Tax=Takifugu flavidus TaxID=433684 RepID=A0A5C6MF75_9TELE|nr:hypothetical protein D4764_0188380 [Takifugu flavidus]